MGARDLLPHHPSLAYTCSIRRCSALFPLPLEDHSSTATPHWHLVASSGKNHNSSHSCTRAPRSHNVILVVFKTQPYCLVFTALLHVKKQNKTLCQFFCVLSDDRRTTIMRVGKSVTLSTQTTTTGDFRTVSLFNSELWQGTQFIYFPLHCKPCLRQPCHSPHIHKHPLCHRETL